LRLWHKDLIPVLPRNRLVAQWRELALIRSSILRIGTPNHILVNKVCDYPFSHFYSYAILIRDEMHRRGYVTKIDVERRILAPWNEEPTEGVGLEQLYEQWHNDRYFLQCYYNLQEKYDCDNVDQEEWRRMDTLVCARVSAIQQKMSSALLSEHSRQANGE
jgi:uncharacterized protein (TIGR02328 family)